VIDPRQLALEGLAHGLQPIVAALEGEITAGSVSVSCQLPTIGVAPPTCTVHTVFVGAYPIASGYLHTPSLPVVDALVRVHMPRIVVAAPSVVVRVDATPRIYALPVVDVSAPRDPFRANRSAHRDRHLTWRRAG
jgi:hypothetical protein